MVVVGDNFRRGESIPFAPPPPPPPILHPYFPSILQFLFETVALCMYSGGGGGGGGGGGQGGGLC